MSTGTKRLTPTGVDSRGLIEWIISYHNELRERKANGENIPQSTLEHMKNDANELIEYCIDCPEYQEDVKQYRKQLEGNDINTSQQHRIEETSGEGKPVKSPGKNLSNIVNLEEKVEFNICREMFTNKEEQIIWLILQEKTGNGKVV